MKKFAIFVCAASMAVAITTAPALAQQNDDSGQSQNMMGNGEHGQNMMGGSGHGQNMMGNCEHGQNMMGNCEHGQGTSGQ